MSNERTKSMAFNGSSLRDLYKVHDGRRKRESSYDRTGGNRDYYIINPSEKRDICMIKGAGIITHIWMTLGPMEEIEESHVHRKMGV